MSFFCAVGLFFSISALLIICKSFCNVSIFGTCLYRSTLYPASVSREILFLSCSSRPLWLKSSSSMIALTLNAFVQITKSVTLRSKRFLVVLSFVCSRAEKATCARTISFGNDSTKRKNIGCSFFVTGDFALIGEFVFVPSFFFDAIATEIINKAMMQMTGKKFVKTVFKMFMFLF